MSKWIIQHIATSMSYLSTKCNRFVFICMNLHSSAFFHFLFTLFSGFYPNCECIDKDYTFSAYINECYIECPDDAEDIHPQCRCYDPNFYYDKIDRICKSNIGRKCPQFSIGIGPECLCIEVRYKFDLSSWLCYDETNRISQTIIPIAQCPDAIKKWPQCDDSIQRNALLSLVG